MALVILTGGARSGKSSVAEKLALKRYQMGQPVIVAVFGNPNSGDAEFEERIRLHRKNRPAGFDTLEAYGKDGWLSEVPEGALLIIDCLGTALSSIMMQLDWSSMPEDGRTLAMADFPIEERFEELVDGIIARRGDTIVVTNEVGDGVVPEYESSRMFRDFLGRGNRKIAAAADAAYFVVCGRLISLADLPKEASWPED